MVHLQKEGLRPNLETPKTILGRNSTYKLRTKTAELPKLRTQKVQTPTFSLKLLVNQKKRKNNIDKKAISRYFYPKDFVLKWDSKSENKGKHGKFDNLWMGPYLIIVVQDNNNFILAEFNHEILEATINGRLLKHFFLY